jgi:transposase
MIKHKNVFGVDISKDFFDVVNSEGTHNQFLNNDNGFEAFRAEIPKRALIVMESTGYYHHRLAQFLVSKKIKTSVINPISVKRYRQMKMSKIKTDKVDAQLICEYAQQHEVPIYKGKSKSGVECQQLIRLVDIYQKQRTALKNKLQGEIDMGSPSLMVIRSIKRQLRTLLSEILAIEKEVNLSLQKRYPDMLHLLEGIPGIGNKTSSYLIMLTDGFKKFDDSKKLCSYAGITPGIYSSGSSIRGKSRIAKMGNPKIRRLLFMCSFSASKYNISCRDLYERIVAKGKSKKLALIAVCNKLLKQVYAIATTGIPYSKEHQQKIINIKSTAYVTSIL